MDILNWLYLAKNKFVRTTLGSTKDLMIFGSNVGFSKRGDKYQNYAMSAEDFTTSVADVVKPYKVYTALLTQSGGDDPGNLISGTLTIGVTYLIQLLEGADFSNVGANNIEGEYFVATGTTPNSWGTGGQLEYNTGAPVVTVLENTIGNVWFSYEGVGYYIIGNSNLLFTDKITVFSGARTAPWDGLTSIDTTNYTNSSFYLSTVDNTGSPTDNLLLNTPIEIRVYN